MVKSNISIPTAIVCFFAISYVFHVSSGSLDLLVDYENGVCLSVLKLRCFSERKPGLVQDCQIIIL